VDELEHYDNLVIGNQREFEWEKLAQEEEQKVEERQKVLGRIVCFHFIDSKPNQLPWYIYSLAGPMQPASTRFCSRPKASSKCLQQHITKLLHYIVGCAKSTALIKNQADAEGDPIFKA
jgi:hypothetical protein